MNFSFAGCGFLGIYHVGVAACLRKYAPDLLVDQISGASAGALAAAALLCDSPLGIITTSVLRVATEARKYFLGPFHPAFNIEQLLKDGLLKVLPDNAHEIVSGRLFISVTRVADGKNVLLSEFKTRAMLVDALLCSAFIPAFSGWEAIEIDGVQYIDGGFSDNLPQKDEKTITVSPFCGEADICPKDNNAGLLTVNLANTSLELSQENLYRFAKILFPPKSSVLNKMCQQGFNDALEFLQRNRLINCTRCLAVQSTINLDEDTPKETKHCHALNEDNCADCKIQREEALLDSLPEAVGTIFQEALEHANSGLLSWVTKEKPKGIIHLLFVLPWQIVKTLLESISSWSSRLQNPTKLIRQMIEVARLLLSSWSRLPSSAMHPHRPSHTHDQAFTCQLDITEFGDTDEVPVTTNLPKFVIDEVDGPSIPYTHRDSVSSESEVLMQLAARCSARSISRFNSRAASRNHSRVPSRAVSRAVSRRPSLGDEDEMNAAGYDGVATPRVDDAFDNILNVTSHQEALMAYYYLDDNNEMKVTEIFDFTKPAPNRSGWKEMDTRPLSEIDLQSHMKSYEGDTGSLLEPLSPVDSCHSGIFSDTEADRYRNVTL